MGFLDIVTYALCRICCGSLIALAWTSVNNGQGREKSVAFRGGTSMGHGGTLPPDFDARGQDYISALPLFDSFTTLCSTKIRWKPTNYTHKIGVTARGHPFLPSLPMSSPFSLPLPILLSSPLPFPSLSLEVAPLNPARESGGAL